MTSKVEWWAYILMVLSVFIVCLFLNFVMKKINEARLHERFLRIQKKASKNCSTQVQEPVPIESSPTEINKQPEYIPKGISFVYNKEDNLNNAHGKSGANLPTESNSASQSKIDATNSKLNFLGTIYTDLVPPKEESDKANPMQNCDNDNNKIFKEFIDRKACIYENKPRN